MEVQRENATERTKEKEIYFSAQKMLSKIHFFNICFLKEMFSIVILYFCART